MKKIYFGKGISDIKGDTSTSFHNRWTRMLVRAYSPEFKAEHPSYADCDVCDEWLTYSNFKAWMIQQPHSGNCLDKDILMPGNKLYCPEYCRFLPIRINNLILDRLAGRGDYLIGASFRKDRVKSGKPWQATVSDPFKPLGKRLTNLGHYATEMEAHLAWREKKLEFVHKYYEDGSIIYPEIYKALVHRYEHWESYNRH